MFRSFDLDDTFSGGTGNVSWTFALRQAQDRLYNPASQITQETKSNNAYAFPKTNVSETGTANGLNQLTSYAGKALSHDTKGNVTAFGSDDFGYTSENLMTSATVGGVSTTLTYDPLTRLYQTVSGGVTSRFAYDGLDAIAEYNSGGTLQRRYVFDPTGITGQPLVWYEGTGTGATVRRYLSSDERGSIISVSDSSGASLAINAYDEYGIPDFGALANQRFGYTGQMWLPSVGVWHYKARMYAPQIGGRFLQPDPIGYWDSPNLYAYVLNDPVNWVDPLGLIIACVHDEIWSCGWIFLGMELTGVMQWEARRDFGAEGGGGGGGGERLPCSAVNQSGKGVLIQLGFTKLGSAPIPGLSHAFVIASNLTTGAAYASRAGPGAGFPPEVAAVSGPYNSSFPDFGAATAYQTVGFVNAPYGAVTSYMNTFAATTNVNTIPYMGFVQNSNSYAASLLAGMGFKPPDTVQNAPGFGSNSPSPQLSCRR